MKQTEKQELKSKLKRIGLFLIIVFLPIAVVCTLLYYVGVTDMWLNVLILVILLFLLFGIFYYVCEKLDQKKKERLSKKKDPFSD